MGSQAQTSLTWCDVCGRLLENPVSRRRGRGRVCDEKRNPRPARPLRRLSTVRVPPGPDLLDLIRDADPEGG